MAVELGEAPDAVARQRSLLARPIRELSALLRAKPPRVVVTCARGSSAHAANFGKYLIERHLGIPVAAAAPSITSIYGKRLLLKDQLFIAVSQSGMSDDLVEAARSAKASGALTVAIVNDPDSPLASACEMVIPLGAGPELSVAATKTFVASLTAFLGLVGAWADAADLATALDRLPGRLEQAAKLDWSQAVESLAVASSVATLGRGPTLAIAQEAALKLKEVCNIHSEAFSGAEFQHGPIALVTAGFPALFLMPNDGSAANLTALAADLCRKRAAVFRTGGKKDDTGEALPIVAADHPDTDAICLIQSFYKFAIDLAEHRGMNVNRPRHLKKVTRTR